MLNYIWATLLFIGIIVAGITGHVSGDGSVIDAAAKAAEKAVMGIALPLAGMMMFWLGVLRLMEKAGVLEAVVRVLSPLLRRLFPDVPREHPAMGAMVMNLSANMLGLSNNATPLGLKAMGHLQELNPHKQSASNAMITFLALNTGAFTLIPVTAMNFLNAAGISNSFRVIVPTILATACASEMLVASAASACGKRIGRRFVPGSGEDVVLHRLHDHGHGARARIRETDAPFAEGLGAAKLGHHGLAGFRAGLGGGKDRRDGIRQRLTGDFLGLDGRRLHGIDAGLVTHGSAAALLHAVHAGAEEQGQTGGVQRLLAYEGLAAVAEEGAKDRAARAAHAAHHLHAHRRKGFLDALHLAGVEAVLRRVHAALHAHAVVAVTEIAVRFGEHGLGGDDALTGKNEHGFDFVFGEAGFGHGGAIS
jgi:spore maturation protein SpmA